MMELLPFSGKERKKDGNVLFNDVHNTFYLRLYTVGHMVKDNSDSYSFRLAERVLIYAPSHRVDNICELLFCIRPT